MVLPPSIWFARFARRFVSERDDSAEAMPDFRNPKRTELLDIYEDEQRCRSAS
jgi:hypothetical protein